MSHDATFIIPAKNEERRIETCLASIIVNADIRYEIIVVDNGSHDNTMAIARKYNAKVVSRPDVPVAELRNIGANNSTGRYLVFLDADVELATKLSTLIQRYEICGNIGILTGPILIPSNATWVERTWSLNRNYTPGASIVSWSSSMNMIINRHIFKQAGGFSHDMISCEDVDLSQRVKRLGYQIVHDSIFKVIHHGEAKSITQLYKKEKWRGSSIIQNLCRNRKDNHVLLSFSQYIYFAIWPLIMVYLIVRISYSFKYLALITYLPIIRSSLISLKIRNICHMPKLITIWTIYFIAREHAILAHFYNPKKIS